MVGDDYLGIESSLSFLVLDGVSRLHDVDLLVAHRETLPGLHDVLALSVDGEDWTIELEQGLSVLVRDLDAALPLEGLLLVGQDVNPGEPGLVPFFKHREKRETIAVIPDDCDPCADLSLLELVLQKTSQSEVGGFLVLPDESVLMFVLDVREYLFELEPVLTLRVRTAHLPAAAASLVLLHGRLQLQHLTALVVIFTVHLQLVVLDHLLHLQVAVWRVGVETVALRTSLPRLFLPVEARERLEPVEAVLTYLVTVLAGVEFLGSWYGETERTLNHVPDSPRLHCLVLSENPGPGESYLGGAADSGQSQYSVLLTLLTPHITQLIPLHCYQML